MGSNDVHLLTLSLDARRKETAPNLKADEFFELFAAEQALRQMCHPDLSDVRSGLVDGGGDGGIDALYTVVSGRVITEPLVPGRGDAGADRGITLLAVQAKLAKGFGETAIQKIADTLDDVESARRARSACALSNRAGVPEA